MFQLPDFPSFEYNYSANEGDGQYANEIKLQINLANAGFSAYIVTTGRVRVLIERFFISNRTETHRDWPKKTLASQRIRSQNRDNQFLV